MTTVPDESGLRVGTLSGAPIRISPTWLLLAVIVAAVSTPSVRSIRPDLGGGALVVAIGYALLLLLSVLIHEMAHAAMAQAYGYRVRAIVASFMGGHTSYDSTGLRPGPAALIALSGPMANLVLGVLAWWIQGLFAPNSVVSLLLFATAIANLFLALFNFLPGLPLDGGQALEALVWRLSGRRAVGTSAAAAAGVLVAAGVFVWFVIAPLRNSGLGTNALWGMLISLYLGRAAIVSFRRARAMGRLDGYTVADVLRSVPVVDVSAVVASVSTVLQGGAIATRSGRPVGLVPPGSLAAIPPERWPHTLVESVIVAQPEAWIIDAPAQAPILAAVQVLAANRLTYAAVVDDGHVLGLVQAPDVNQILVGRAAKAEPAG
ncbi:MAG: site-2 protease family protein [Nostocoides sp.]